MEELNLNTDESAKLEKKKSKTGLIVAIISIVIGLILIISVFLGGESGSDKKWEITNVTMEKEYSEYIGWDVQIKGTIKNISGRDYDYVQVEYVVYDASGNNIGTAIDNINNLAAGDTWSFSAHLLDWQESEPASFKIVEVTGW